MHVALQCAGCFAAATTGGGAFGGLKETQFTWRKGIGAAAGTDTVEGHNMKVDCWMSLL